MIILDWTCVARCARLRASFCCRSVCRSCDVPTSAGEKQGAVPCVSAMHASQLRVSLMSWLQGRCVAADAKCRGIFALLRQSCIGSARSCKALCHELPSLPTPTASQEFGSEFFLVLQGRKRARVTSRVRHCLLSCSLSPSLFGLACRLGAPLLQAAL